MANLDLLENSIPVAPLKLAALPGSMEMAKKVDAYLVQFRNCLLYTSSAVPAASAMTFFRAPPSSIPVMSGLV